MNISDEDRTETGQNSVIAPSDAFIKALRSALNHLYNPDNLRQNELAVAFGVDHRFDTPSAMQNILTNAIESLKPRTNAPNRIHAQTIYDVLLYRYVHHVNQDEIAGQLGISVRQLRRQQNLAVYHLACQLWEKFDLGSKSLMAKELKPIQRETPMTNPGSKDSELTQELDWLSDSSLRTQIDLAHAVPDALELIQPLLAQNKARVDLPETNSGLLMAHPVAFQQVLLSLLYFSIKICGENEVKLEIIPQLGRQEIQVSGIRSEQTVPGEGEEQRLLETLRQLVHMSQGRFSYHPTGDIFQAVVSFDAVEIVPVLVIDDNPEIITLMQRFTVNTPYRIHGVNEPRLAIEQALKVLPKIIVLDIMMPQVDGLQVLSWFKHHPNLGHIPVIVCSVMPQKDLADSLGASGFISKPILRESLIAVLDTTIEREVR